MTLRLLGRATQPSLAQAARLRSTIKPLSVNLNWNRHATGTVSNQPASRNLKEMGQNAKSEAKSIKKDIESAISGANDRTSQISGDGSVSELKTDMDAASIIFRKVPPGAMLFGAAGVLPYFGTSAATVYLSRQATLSLSPENSTLDADTALALLHHVENLQLGYGALILSFIGAIHWGMEFAAFNGHKGTPRYLLGITPVLLGMSTLTLSGAVGLAAQFAAFTVTWFIDRTATTWGWMPLWYSTYRFWLTLAVGSSLVGTLALANVYGPGSELATTGRRLAQVNKAAEDRLKNMQDRRQGLATTGTIGGDISATAGGEDGDAFVNLSNDKKKAEAAAKQKEEEEKKAEEDKQKAKDDADKAAKEAKEKTKSGSKTPGA